MKKFLFVLAVAATVLAGCSKDNPTGGDLSISKLDVEFNFSTISSTITDAYSVVVAGKDFAGKPFIINVPTTGSYKISVDNPNTAGVSLSYGVYVDPKNADTNKGELYEIAYTFKVISYNNGVKSGSQNLIDRSSKSSSIEGVPDSPVEKTITFGGNSDNVTFGIDTTPVSETYYAGEFYKTVVLGSEYSTNTWMAENLRYVPAGKKVSTDPTDGSGVWSPYTSDGTTCTADTTLIKDLGLLYSAEVLLGHAVSKSDTLSSFEGERGICPVGWSIPTRAQYFNLCGYSNKSNYETAAQVDTNAVYYVQSHKGSTIKKMNEVGFSYQFSGSVANSSYQKITVKTTTTSVTEYVGKLGMTYYWTSSIFQGSATQLFALMSTFSATYMEGRLTLATSTATNGCAVRCVKSRR